MKIFSWNKKKKIKKNKIKKNKINNTNNICSICLDKCNIIFCNNCYNYVHLKCIKKYISYNNYHINTEKGSDIRGVEDIYPIFRELFKKNQKQHQGAA